jgi:uncharacterized membrane-anchored protein YhcB (DUF1043 family)
MTYPACNQEDRATDELDGIEASIDNSRREIEDHVSDLRNIIGDLQIDYDNAVSREEDALGLASDLQDKIDDLIQELADAQSDLANSGA